jgi:hypothetical protein
MYGTRRRIAVSELMRWFATWDEAPPPKAKGTARMTKLEHDDLDNPADGVDAALRRFERDQRKRDAADKARAEALERLENGDDELDE